MLHGALSRYSRRNVKKDKERNASSCVPDYINEMIRLARETSSPRKSSLNVTAPVGRSFPMSSNCNEKRALNGKQQNYTCESRSIPARGARRVTLRSPSHFFFEVSTSTLDRAATSTIRSTKVRHPTYRRQIVFQRWQNIPHLRMCE